MIAGTFYVLRRYSNSCIGEQRMNWDRVEGNWKEFKGKVRQKWGKLTMTISKS